jgi:PA-IL-like protein
MRKLLFPLLVPVLILTLAASSFPDTIRLKDGSVIHGQVVGFKDQQFTVLIGAGAKGRRSRTTIYVEDIESIEFDNSGVDNVATSDTIPASPPPRTSTQPNIPRSEPAPTNSTNSGPTFFTIKVSVRSDNTNNGWTNSGLVVRKGQRLRISASGRISLGRDRFSTPGGVGTIPDRDKLMRNEATGGLIAVIGDDNDDFIFLGTRRDFVAQRDGVLFLGVNEGELSDNTGTYDIVIEAEAGGTSPR